MYKKLIFSLLLVGVLVFGLVFASCDGGSSKLVGVWESKEGVMELLKDGTGKFDGDSITWKAEKTMFFITMYGMTIAGEYKLSGSTLIVTADGETSIFTKKK